MTDIENQVDKRLFDGDIEDSALNHPIGEKEIKAAAEILERYKAGKANLDRRVVEDEEWWKLRHWPFIRGNQRTVEDEEGKRVWFPGPEPASAWLFNAILNKHADAMDNYPEPAVLPREPSDEPAAKVLSSVLPVILQYNDFEEIYSDNWWDKLLHGTAVYGVYWNAEKENGLGDIDIRPVDLLKIFWEPGITDIQKSRNLFIVELIDHDLLNRQYPQFHGKIDGSPIDISQYIYNDSVDTTGKDLVVDWYYKVKMGSKTILHYCKFCGDTLLYASENDPLYRDRGYYDHGMYPVVMDVMFPEKGTPAGFGYVAICKDPQMYIDKLSANILETSMMGTKKRFIISGNTNINEDELVDWNKPVVHAEGELDGTRMMPLEVQPPAAIYMDVMTQKIEEMKDTAANRDVNSGGSAGGVTAASAIAALQEAGNKASRDMIAASYRAQTQIAKLVVELIRQFYDEARAFRITAPNGMGYEFTELSNGPLRNQPIMGPNGPMMSPQGEILMRRPIFDLKISAQRRNPFSRMEQNERAKELYSMGFFNPEQAQQSLTALDMMDFEGIEKVREKVSEGQTLLNIVRQQQAQLQALAAAVMGIPPQAAQQAPEGASGGGQPVQQEVPQNGRNELASAMMAAHKPMTSYGQRLARRSTPNMDLKSSAAAPV